MAPCARRGLLVGSIGSAGRTNEVSRYFACPSNGHGIHKDNVAIAVKVTRDGKKKCPTGRCPVCWARVFLPNGSDPRTSFHSERGWTAEECAERGLLVLQA